SLRMSCYELDGRDESLARLQYLQPCCVSFGSEPEWIRDTGIWLEANRLTVHWRVGHTLSEIMRKSLNQSSTAAWIGQDCLHNPVLRWLQMREICIEPSAGKRLARRQIKRSIRRQQPAHGELIARFPYFRCGHRDLCHFRISAVNKRQPEVGVRAESVRQGAHAGIFTFNLRGELQALDRISHPNPEVARPARQHRPIVGRCLKLAADAVDPLLHGTPRPVINETMNRIAEAVAGLEGVLAATERESRFADPTWEREQQGHATSGGRLVSTRKVRMRPEHLACSVLQYGPPAETIEAQAHQNTCGGAGGRISDRNNMWGLHCAR